MQTFRRLNDPERYYGMSWRGWLAAGTGGGLLYVAVRFSPLPARPTITIAVLALAGAGVALFGLSGQAIGPGRYLTALIRHRIRPKLLTCPEASDKLGLVLQSIPEPPADAGENRALEDQLGDLRS